MYHLWNHFRDKTRSLLFSKICLSLTCSRGSRRHLPSVGKATVFARFPAIRWWTQRSHIVFHCDQRLMIKSDSRRNNLIGLEWHFFAMTAVRSANPKVRSPSAPLFLRQLNLTAEVHSKAPTNWPASRWKPWFSWLLFSARRLSVSSVLCLKFIFCLKETKI